MIAEQWARRGGRGIESIALMLLYGIHELRLTQYTAKIGRKNTSSIQLFQQRLEFVPVSVSEAFDETTFELDVNDDVISKLHSLSPNYKIATFTCDNE